MHHAIEEIIDRLIGAVTSQKPYYTLKDLLAAGFPPFIVERIRVEINEKLKKELTRPESEWANLDASLAEDAWLDFQQAVFSNSHIPHARLYSFVGEVVTEIVKVFLEPRQHMADYIFQNEEELDFEELISRTGELTIYKHFARAIPLYMQKRNLKKLDKQKCKALIHNLDARLVASYSPEEWAQILNPIFVLYGGKVDAKLIQLFFEDKDLFLTAKTFNELDEEITKKRFIEVLSYPDLLDVELQEKYRDKYRKELITQKNRFDTPDTEEVEMDEKESKLIDHFFEGYEEESLAVSESADMGSFNDAFRSDDEDSTISDEFEEEDEISEEPLPPANKSKEPGRFHDNLVSVLDEAASSYKNLTEEESEEEKEISSRAGDETPDIETEMTEDEGSEPSPFVAPDPEEEIEPGDEKPMWQQYISAEQMDFIMAGRDEDEEELIEEVNEEIEEREEAEDIPSAPQEVIAEEPEDESEEEPETDLNALFSDNYEDEDNAILVGDDDFIDDPVTDFQYAGSEDEELETEVFEEESKMEKLSLKEFLEDREKIFVKKLFKGSKKTYVKALAEMNAFEDWGKASNYLKEEIFKRNNIDMFSEAAIEFTDRLQTYFTDHK